LKNPRLAIICPIYNAKKYIPDFLESFKKQTFSNFKLFIIDDGSVDGSSALIKEIFPNVVIIQGDGNYWWTKSINKGIKDALVFNPNYFLLINVDLIVEENYLETLLKYIPNDNTIIGSAQYDINNRKLISLGGNRNWLTAKDIQNIDIYPNSDKILLPVSHFCGRGLLIPAVLIRTLGLFDEKRFPHYAADDVYTFVAAKKGVKVVCNKLAKIYSDQENTGITKLFSELSLSNFYNYITSIKSSGNLKIRWRAAFYIAPKKYLIPYVFIDTIRTIGSYIKSFLMK